MCNKEPGHEEQTQHMAGLQQVDRKHLNRCLHAGRDGLERCGLHRKRPKRRGVRLLAGRRAGVGELLNIRRRHLPRLPLRQHPHILLHTAGVTRTHDMQ